MFEQKTYRATLRFQGSPLHTLALEGVTKHELKLLAFLHGNNALPPAEIRFLGLQKIVDIRFVDGKREKIVIESEMEEMKRLARKYDTLGDHDGINRGKTIVQKCFGVQLDDFEDLFSEVDPVSQAEAAMAAAELKADAMKRGEKVELDEGNTEGASPPVVGTGEAAGGSKPPPAFDLSGAFKRTKSEGVSP